MLLTLDDLPLTILVWVDLLCALLLGAGLSRMLLPVSILWDACCLLVYSALVATTVTGALLVKYNMLAVNELFCKE